MDLLKYTYRQIQLAGKVNSAVMWPQVLKKILELDPV